MSFKTIFAALTIFGLIFATAPAWIQPGVNLNYTGSDGNTYSYTVLNKSGLDNIIEIRINGNPASSAPETENGSASSGRFWYDSSLLSGAFVGGTVGDDFVSSTGQLSAGGVNWNTTTLDGAKSGATITKVVDKNNGILIKQTITAGGLQQVITLKNFNIPILFPPAKVVAPTPTTPSSPSTPPTQTTPAQPSNTGSSNTQSDQTNIGTVSSNTSTDTTNEPIGSLTTDDLKPPASNVPCCPVLFGLLFIGFLSFAKKN
ncbi:MAG: hypothetical protein AABX38_04580 [Candidatus Micrarchaeota archaeon]